jgi:hypothetical protein
LPAFAALQAGIYGQPKVPKLELALPSEEDVLRLDVPAHGLKQQEQATSKEVAEEVAATAVQAVAVQDPWRCCSPD